MRIKRFIAIAAWSVVSTYLTAGTPCSAAQKNPRFISPGVLSASDIQYPVNSMAAGAVSLLLRIDSSAKIEDVQILRDFPPLTNSVEKAVQTWTLTPAILNGQAVSSEVSVTVIFNIFNPAGGAAYQSLVLAPPTATPGRDSQYIPPQISMASFAKYPANSVSVGAVVLDVTVNKAGNVSKIAVIRGVPTLTEQAIIAVKTWGFIAASIQGQPTAAQIVVAFVFQRNTS
jgi:TonB family protein